MIDTKRNSLVHDLLLPTLLFAALGGMTWAVRGSSGYGAVAGCIFAGVTWGAAWWYIAHDPTREQSRRYSSAWIVLAMTVGIGLAGGRGWMQWPSFFEEKLQTNWGKNEFVPISRTYGFVWLFIAGMPWAGLAACMLAWCGSLREMRAWHWVIRIACGLGGAMLARYLFETYPQYFLPLYESMESQYRDVKTNPNLGRLINDSRSAITHMGYYLGFLLFEIARRDWKNVVLIVTVGVVNGAGWAACQNWKWAFNTWPGVNFNWWRCWESSGGISIGVAYGIAYFLVNRRMSDSERAIVASRPAMSGPHFEWFLIYSGLAWLLSLFLAGSMGGWGRWYFSVVLGFGAAYYFMVRRTSMDERPSGPRVLAILTNIEWGALVLAAAFIAGLFYPFPRDARAFYGRLSLAGAVAAGLVWYWLNRARFDAERARTSPRDGDPNLERLGLYLGLLTGLGLSIRNGLKGWFNIYWVNKVHTEDYYSRQLWEYLGPVYLVILIAIVGWILLWPLPRNFRGRLFPHAYAAMWLVLIVQNTLAQLITGPLSRWNEMAFNIYYILLFVISAVILFHYYWLKEEQAARELV